MQLGGGGSIADYFASVWNIIDVLLMVLYWTFYALELFWVN
jgi:hypothetical protein